MNKSLEWMKQHKGAAAAIIVGAVIVVYLVMRSRGSSGAGGGLASAIAAQQQGQLQMAQLNAQLGAQTEQANAQLAASEYQTQAQQAEQQNQILGDVALGIIPTQIQAKLVPQELAAQLKSQQAMIPLYESAISLTNKGGRTNAGVNELALLLNQGGINSFNQYAQAQAVGNEGNLFGLSLPGGTGVNIGSGLFG